MAQIATFKKASAIEFDVKMPIRKTKPRLKDAKLGSTFLWQASHGRHDAAICMRTEVSAYQSLLEHCTANQHADLSMVLKDAIFITNLQTGRTFAAVDCDIEYVKLKVTVEGA